MRLFSRHRVEALPAYDPEHAYSAGYTHRMIYLKQCVADAAFRLEQALTERDGQPAGKDLVENARTGLRAALRWPDSYPDFYERHPELHRLHPNIFGDWARIDAEAAEREAAATQEP